MAASGQYQEHDLYPRRVSVLAAASAIAIALVGLSGYVPGLELLGTEREGYMLMTPSTAISFTVLGSILLAVTLRPLWGACLVLFGTLAALVSLFGALEVGEHLSGRDLNLKHALVTNADYLENIPAGHMSPPTGALFLLAGFAVIALVLRRSGVYGWGTRLGYYGGSLGGIVLIIGLGFCLTYLSGLPLSYSRGDAVPMALTTALAFLMLGTATIGASN